MIRIIRYGTLNKIRLKLEHVKSPHILMNQLHQTTQRTK